MVTDTVQDPSSNGLELLPKAATGISGLDEVTGGGLPRGRSTLVCGPAGCGKTLLGMEFLVRGITAYGEPGVFVAFEETREDLIANVASLGFDLSRFEAEGQLALEHVGINPSEVVQSGAWDLEGLFIRLGSVHRRSGRQAGGDRHHREPLRGLSGQRHGAFGAPAPLPLAQGPGDHGDHHGRARHRSADAPRHRGIRVRLRDRARPPRERGDLHPPAPGAQVPRLAPRDERVPVPDRQGRGDGGAHHLARPGARRLRRAAVHGRGPARRDARRPRRAARQLHPRERHRGHGQVHRGRPVLRRGMPSWRAGALLRIRGIRGADRAQHGLGGHGPPAVGGPGPAALQVRPAQPARASRPISRRCRTWSRSTSPRWSCWIRSRTC